MVGIRLGKDREGSGLLIKMWKIRCRIPGNEEKIGAEFHWELLKGNSLEIPHSGIRQHREY